MTTAALPFSERIHADAAGARVYTLATPVEDVVSFAGAIRTWPDFSSGGALIQDVTTMLLDKGTHRRDRFEIAKLIDNRGAQVSFRSNSSRIAFSGRALRDDLPDVLNLVAEQLRDPLFDPDEFAKARAQLIGQIRRQMENTAAQSSGALTRLIYPPSHPNYQFPLEAELDALSALTVQDIQGFYRAHVGPRELTMVLVGDVDRDASVATVNQAFVDWQGGDARGTYDEAGMKRSPERVEVAVPEKQNLDVRIGHGVAVRRDAADYVPLLLGNFILGGNFSSRLMTIIRDQMGLTYGISSQLAGVSVDFDGYWKISVTLSGTNLERGVEAVRRVAARFADEGVSDAEVETARTTLTGSFIVDLASTGGLAHTILVNVLRGFGPGYLDSFPKEIEETSADAVNEAIRNHIHPAEAHVAVAGDV